jgi:predicted DNA-binding transcriptional regulator AlpA
MDTPRFFTEQELAEMLKISVHTLRDWRYRRQQFGPRWVRIGRLVRYAQEDVEQFLRAAREGRQSDAAAD